MGKINISDKIMFKNQKKRENVEIKDNKRLFWNGIHIFLRPADDRGSADIIYRI